ncbi:hypothetical protein FRC12_024813 [Ceratobasidium sp. 428]|nr:hypothetical protein FRC12_024813 [Ceratobasidium sp. 428]
MIYQPFVHEGCRLRIHFDTKHIPADIIPSLACEIGRGGGEVSKDPALSDVLVVDPAYPRAFEDFLRTWSDNQRPPVVLVFWVSLCVSSQKLIWFGHPYWNYVSFPYEQSAHPISAGILAYACFLAGRTSVQLVPDARLQICTPGLMANAVLEAFKLVALEADVNPTLDASTPVRSLTTGTVSAIEASHGSTGLSDLMAPPTAVPSASPSTSKRLTNSGLRLATVGGGNRKEPLDRLNCTSKIQQLPQRTETSPPQVDPVAVAPHAESVTSNMVPVQPQTNVTMQGSAKDSATPSVTTSEAPRTAATDGLHSGTISPAASAVLTPSTSSAVSGAAHELVADSEVSHSNESTSSETNLIQTNEHSRGMTETRLTATLANIETEITPSTDIADDSQSTAIEFALTPSTTSSPHDQKEPVSVVSHTTTDKPHALPINGPKIRLPPKPPSYNISHETGPHAPNGTKGKGKERAPTPFDPNQLTQTSIATTLKSTPAPLSGRSSSASTAFETAPESILLTPLGSPDRIPSGSRTSRLQLNESSNASSSLSSAPASSSRVQTDNSNQAPAVNPPRYPLRNQKKPRMYSLLSHYVRTD